MVPRNDAPMRTASRILLQALLFGSLASAYFIGARGLVPHGMSKGGAFLAGVALSSLAGIVVVVMQPVTRRRGGFLVTGCFVGTVVAAGWNALDRGGPQQWSSFNWALLVIWGIVLGPVGALAIYRAQRKLAGTP